MKRVEIKKPQLIAIPAGPEALKQFLETEKHQPWQTAKTMLLMGLGGSLSPECEIGRGVLIDRVWNLLNPESPECTFCDSILTQTILQRCSSLSVATGVTSDRVITSAQEKRTLGDRYSASVVDMESAVLVQAIPHAQLAVLRVISDDCHHDLPNIEQAIAPDGSLRPVVLALRFLQRPLAAARLVRGSLKGLKTLEALALDLFQSKE
ncbi:MAG: phosphorylase [Synechococcales cyanobacterium T60_A2020_003]|nr:phosphorylase [Synechococcales cyanobacterium T60_A2020_003]